MSDLIIVLNKISNSNESVFNIFLSFNETTIRAYHSHVFNFIAIFEIKDKHAIKISLLITATKSFARANETSFASK